MKQFLKPLQIYVPITRVDEDERTAEGYAFVNEVVEGEGGLQLKRSAMEETTPEYMQWGAVREMHQPIAAGTAIGVEWDEKGAYLRAKIVDDAAWNKVKEGVYKGFSVGVAARVMRGKVVEKANWIETSLVDRPKDPDAKIVAYRADTMQDEYEVEMLDEDAPPVQRSFADMVDDLRENDVMQDMCDAWWAFCSRCYNEDLEKEALRTNIDQLHAYLITLLDENEAALRVEIGAAIQRAAAKFDAFPNPDLARLQTLESERTDLTTRLQTTEADLARVQGALTETTSALATATERVRTLEALPAPTKAPPVRFTMGLPREFAANLENPDPEAQRAADLLVEYRQLEKTLPQEANEQARFDGVTRMLTIKPAIAHLL